MFHKKHPVGCFAIDDDMEYKVVKIYFNPHEVITEDGMKFINYDSIEIGQDLPPVIPTQNFRTCLSMKKAIDENGDRYIIAEFNDGTTDEIYNYSHITLADEPTYQRLLPDTYNIPGKENTEQREQGSIQGGGQE